MVMATVTAYSPASEPVNSGQRRISAIATAMTTTCRRKIS